MLMTMHTGQIDSAYNHARLMASVVNLAKLIVSTDDHKILMLGDYNCLIHLPCMNLVGLCVPRLYLTYGSVINSAAI